MLQIVRVLRAIEIPRYIWHEYPAGTEKVGQGYSPPHRVSKLEGRSFC